MLTNIELQWNAIHDIVCSCSNNVIFATYVCTLMYTHIDYIVA